MLEDPEEIFFFRTIDYYFSTAPQPMQLLTSSGTASSSESSSSPGSSSYNSTSTCKQKSQFTSLRRIKKAQKRKCSTLFASLRGTVLLRGYAEPFKMKELRENKETISSLDATFSHHHVLSARDYRARKQVFFLPENDALFKIQRNQNAPHVH